MRQLVRLVTLRHMRAAPGRSLLTLFGVVLGVAVVFAIDVVNTSVMSSFRYTVDQVAGKTALVVGDGMGVPEEMLETVRAVPGVAVAVPVIRESARDVKRSVQLTVLGVDVVSDNKVRDYEVTSEDVQIKDDLAFLNDPNGVLITQSYAKRHGLQVGDTLRLNTVNGESDFNVRGTLAPRGPAKVFGGDLLLMDVFAAQIAFERGKRFDSIDVVPAPGIETEELAKRIKQAIHEKASVTRPERRTQDAERLLSVFKLGLSVASLLAIFVGGFIVYNALAIAVVQRRREIGILRALGVTRRQTMALFVGEGLLLGAIGSLLGIVLGYALARAALTTVSSTITEQLANVRPDEVTLTPFAFVVGMATGVAAAFVSAFFPARAAATIEPASAMRKQANASGVVPTSTSTSVKYGVGLLIGAAVLAVAVRLFDQSAFGYGVVSAIVCASAAFAPAMTKALGSLLSRVAARRADPAIHLGVLGFIRNAGRTSVAIAALGLALGSALIADFFIRSLQHNTIEWLNRTLRADIMVVGGKRLSIQSEVPLSETLGDRMGAMQGVEFVNRIRLSRQRFNDRPYDLVSHDIARSSQYEEIPVIEGDFEEALPEIVAGRGVMANSAFVHEFGVKLGDELTLETPQGPRKFRVSLIYLDYNSQLGILSTTRDVYTRIWQDRLVDLFGVYTAKGASSVELRDRIKLELGTTQELMVLDNAAYKREATKVIDRAFTMMRAIEVVSIIVAMLGIANALIVTVIDRKLELGILMAIGAARGQVQRVFLTEAALIGGASALLGIAGGCLASLYVVKELARLQLGWELNWDFSFGALVQVLLIAEVAALLAAWLPIRRATKLDVVDALAYE